MKKILSLFSIALIAINLNVIAQTFTYEGPYPYLWKSRPFANDLMKMYSDEINATYQYTLDDDTDERIYNGSFNGHKTFNLKDKDGNPFISSISITGNFVNDVQDGEWIYDYNYADKHIKCMLNFKNGLLDGIQTLDVKQDGKSLKYWETLKNGMYAGENGIESTEGKSGKVYFTENGLPTGKWEFVTGNKTHKISFDDNGQVIKARSIDNRTGDIEQWDLEQWEKNDVFRGSVSWALTLFKSRPIPSKSFDSAMVGDYSDKTIEIFDLLHPMRKTKGYADETYITQPLSDTPAPKPTPAQTQQPILTSVDVDKEAEFPGGEEELNIWVTENVDRNWIGKVGISFDVMTDGSIKNVKIVRGLGPAIDTAMKKLFSSPNMPKWIPAEKDGKPVNSRKTVMVRKQKRNKK